MGGKPRSKGKAPLWVKMRKKNNSNKHGIISKAEPKAETFSTTTTNAHVQIFRYNPLMDFTSRYHNYSLPLHEGESVLELLERIKHQYDGSLTFRSSCGTGACGTCGIKVNGKPVLGCLTQVKEHLDAHGNIRIEPLDEKKLLKDLVIDEKEFFAQYDEVNPWMELRANEHARQHRVQLEEIKHLGKSPFCINCSICNTNAQADLSKELGPAAFVKGYRYLRDVRDGDVSRMETLQSHLPVHYSIEKANYCPRDIEPGKIIEWIKKQKMGKNPISKSK